VKDFPSDEACQNIGREINLSETAFVKPIGANHFHIRWFTPTTEVKLCGHATLASAHILYEEQFVTADKISFDSLSGNLIIYKNQNELILDFPLQKTGPTLDIPLFENVLETAINNAVKALDDFIVELKDATAVTNFVPNFEKINTLECRGLIITAIGNTPYDFVSRFFAPRVGVLEDPVTGSAHCKLADYWQKKLGKTSFLAYQASKRGGEIKVSIHNERVHLSGRAVTIMKGKWLSYEEQI